VSSLTVYVYIFVNAITRYQTAAGYNYCSELVVNKQTAAEPNITMTIRLAGLS